MASEELNKLATTLKSYPNAIKLVITNCRTAIFIDATSKKLILKQEFPINIDHPNNVQPVTLRDTYHFVQFISIDLLTTLVCLCVGSAIMHLVLYSNGQLVLSNESEYEAMVVEKLLVGSVFSRCDNSNVRTLCKMQCIIKFIKQVVNPLVNSSQKSCLLGIPLHREQPLVLQFLLSGGHKRNGIYEYFLMYPFDAPLKHKWTPGSNQNSVELGISTLASSSMVLQTRVHTVKERAFISDTHGPQGPQGPHKDQI